MERNRSILPCQHHFGVFELYESCLHFLGDRFNSFGTFLIMKGVSKILVAFALFEEASHYLYILNILGYASIIGLF